MKYMTDDGKVFDDEAVAKRHERAMQNPKRTIRFSGHSDDIVYIDSTPMGNDNGEYYLNQTFVLRDKKGSGLIVTPIYDGTWSFAVGMLEEDIPILWPVKFNTRGYSADLYIDVPEGVYVSAEYR